MLGRSIPHWKLLQVLFQYELNPFNNYLEIDQTSVNTANPLLHNVPF